MYSKVARPSKKKIKGSSIKEKKSKKQKKCGRYPDNGHKYCNLGWNMMEPELKMDFPLHFCLPGDGGFSRDSETSLFLRRDHCPKKKAIERDTAKTFLLGEKMI